MGGFGSGGHRWGRHRALAGNCYTLDAKRLYRAGLFAGHCALYWAWGSGENKDLTAVITNPGTGELLELTIVREGERRTHRVRFSHVACHFGKVRYFLHCPLCGRRVCKLFCYPHLYADGKRLTVFWCRHCLGMSYASRNDNHDGLGRGQRRAGRIKRRLGDSNDDWEIPPSKPKWMRWATYTRHMEKFEAAVYLANASFVEGALKRMPELAARFEELDRLRARDEHIY